MRLVMNLQGTQVVKGLDIHICRSVDTWVKQSNDYLKLQTVEIEVVTRMYGAANLD